MKVGVIVDNEYINDVRVVRETLILRDHGFEVFVLCYGFGKTYKSAGDKITVTRFKINRKLRDIIFFLLNTIPLYEWIWSDQITEIHLEK